VNDAGRALRAIGIAGAVLEPAVSAFELREAVAALDALAIGLARRADPQSIGFGAGAVIVIATACNKARGDPQAE
jgi:hypothetical protein